MFREAGPLKGRVLLVNNGTLFIARPDGTVRGGFDGLYFGDERRVDAMEVRLGDSPLSLLWSRSADYRTLEVWAVVSGGTEAPTALTRLRYELLSDCLQISVEPLVLAGTERPTLSVRFHEAATDIFVIRGLPAGIELPPEARAAASEPEIALEVEVLCGERADSDEVRFRPGDSGRIIIRTNSKRVVRNEATCGFSSSSGTLEDVWRASMDDLTALRMRDHEVRDTEYLAGGAPWYLTLFGRDSLIAGIEASLVAPELLLGALKALAARQGEHYDERTAEAPGKILHELRRGSFVRSARGWGTRYYGSVDATALFLIALCHAWRRGCSADAIFDLLPNARRAAEYLMASRDVGPDGLLYYRHGELGLANQGWKDSPDGVRFRDGRLPTGDVALVEVQGYVAAALRDFAQLKRSLRIDDGADLDARAAHVAGRLKSFWMDDERTFAQALTSAGEVVDSVTSSPGHLLWAGVLSDAEAATLAKRLSEPDLMTGFGLRTLATTQTAYNPLSYHCGSVWPHDSAMAAVGMLRYRLAEGERLAWSLLEGAETLGGHLPELVVGLPRDSTRVAVPGTIACSPQAWASAAPIALVQGLLGLDFDLPNGRLRVAARLPDDMCVELVRVPVGRGTMSLRVLGRTVEFCDAPDLDVDV